MKRIWFQKWDGVISDYNIFLYQEKIPFHIPKRGSVVKLQKIK